MMHQGASCDWGACVDAIPSLGVPQLRLQDGPAGVADGATGVTQLPAPVAGAATWDTGLMQQYGQVIGGYQAISHLLAEGLALIEGSVSILRYAAWAVDEVPPADALRIARIAKVYCGMSARTVCETAIQVHGGIGNTWECPAHVYLRRVLVASELFPVRLEEIEVGLP